jgi:hypothetical protein
VLKRQIKVQIGLGRPFIFRIFWCVYVFAFANLLSNTLLGLFYLTDRIHRPNKIAEWASPPSEKG